MDPFAFTPGATDFAFGTGLDFTLDDSFDEFIATDGLPTGIDAALGDGTGAAV